MTTKKLTKQQKHIALDALNNVASPLASAIDTETLSLIMRFFNEEVEAALPSVTNATSPHDRLFDAIITRFEVFQPYRVGVWAISELCRKKPDLALCMYKLQVENMRVMLKYAGIRSNSQIVTHYLLTLYALCFAQWEKDTTNELSHTMAYLGRTLSTGLSKTILVL